MATRTPEKTGKDERYARHQQTQTERNITTQNYTFYDQNPTYGRPQTETRRRTTSKASPSAYTGTRRHCRQRDRHRDGGAPCNPRRKTTENRQNRHRLTRHIESRGTPQTTRIAKWHATHGMKANGHAAPPPPPYLPIKLHIII